MSLLRRKIKKRAVRALRFFQRFRNTDEAAFRAGNRVELFKYGGDFFPAMLCAFQDARHSICAEFYIIRDDSTGCAFAEALLSAAARGVEVLLLYDYVGCFDTSRSYFRRLDRGGVRCIPFNPPPFRNGIAWFDKRDHRKMAIIDGATVFAGGVNIGDEYDGFAESLNRWRDLGVRIDGPVVAELQRLFLESWQGEGGVAPHAGLLREGPDVRVGDAKVMIVSGGPHHNRSFIHGAFRMAIAGAARSVRIINPYFVPGPRVVRSLLRAAGRGVRVQIMLPATNDVPLVRLVSRSYYTALLKGGIEVYEREGTVLHAKVMLIDDGWAVIGSANLDQRSFHRNYELNVIVDSKVFGRQVAEMFRDDLTMSRRIVLDEHERRGLLVRFLERLCSPVSWFL
jgi:cardiolipin synthase